MKALQILVVEDDSLIAMLLVETLEEMGHIVCGVEATESGAVMAALRCRLNLVPARRPGAVAIEKPFRDSELD